MTEDKGGRELTPREPAEVEADDASLTPVQPRPSIRSFRTTCYKQSQKPHSEMSRGAIAAIALGFADTAVRAALQPIIERLAALV